MAQSHEATSTRDYQGSSNSSDDEEDRSEKMERTMSAEKALLRPIMMMPEFRLHGPPDPRNLP
ncbi:hypothetical protein FS837_001688, partial [Tulasnella sp. UAMH 9824]